MVGCSPRVKSSLAQLAARVLSIHLRAAHHHGADADLEGEYVDSWSDGEARESELVLMGSNLDHEALERGLRGCVVSPETLEKKLNI